MRSPLFRWFCLLLLLAGPAHSADGPIFVIPLKGEIDSAQANTIRTGLRRAAQEKASLIILDVDSFGGRVDSAFEEMDALLETKIPTVAFVNQKAISAAALVALATDKIYFHPSGTFGAAMVATPSEEPPPATLEKVTAMVVAKARAAAKAKHHPEDIAEAMISLAAEVRRNDRLVDGKKTLFVVDGIEAVKKYDGVPLLGTGLAKDLPELTAALGATGRIIHVAPVGPDPSRPVFMAIAIGTALGGLRLAWPFLH